MLGFGSLGEFSLGESPIGPLPVQIDPGGNVQIRRARAGAAALMRGHEGHDGAFAVWHNDGWPVQPPQPPHPRPERFAAIAPREDGIEAVFVYVAPLSDAPAWQFSAQEVQPPHPAPERRAGAIMAGDDGDEGLFQAWQNAGWEVRPPQPPTRVESPGRRAAATMRGDDGDQNLYMGYFPAGWSVQPVQPPHPAPERRAGALMRGDDGDQARFFVPFLIDGWGARPPQPPRWPRLRFAGAIMAGDDGTALPEFYPFDRFEVMPTALRARSRRLAPAPTSAVEFRAAAVDAATWAIDTTELLRRRHLAAAVEIEPSFVPTPPRPPWGYDAPDRGAPRRRRPAKSPDLADLLQPFPRPTTGFEFAPPPIRARRGRPSAADRGHELVSSFQVRFPLGFPVQPWQPPHPRRERSGALMRGADGTDGPMVVSFREGWAPALPWPPHPRPESAGGLMAGDHGGAWGPFVYLVPSEAIAFDFAVYLADAFDIGQPP